MSQVNVHEAKTHLSKLLTRVAAGEEIVISKAGKPVARLVPWRQNVKQRTPGLDSGLLTVPDDFDSPLPSEIMDAFET
jgi:prevent-host-death family protein